MFLSQEQEQIDGAGPYFRSQASDDFLAKYKGRKYKTDTERGGGGARKERKATEFDSKGGR